MTPRFSGWGGESDVNKSVADFLCPDEHDNFVLLGFGPDGLRRLPMVLKLVFAALTAVVVLGGLYALDAFIGSLEGRKK